METTSRTRFRSSSCCFDASTSSYCIKCCSSSFACSLARASDSDRPRSRSAACSAAAAAADSESDSACKERRAAYFPSPAARFWRSVAGCARCSPPGPALDAPPRAYRHLELHAHLDQLVGELLVRRLHALDRRSCASLRSAGPTQRRLQLISLLPQALVLLGQLGRVLLVLLLAGLLDVRRGRSARPSRPASSGTSPPFP